MALAEQTDNDGWRQRTIAYFQSCAGMFNEHRDLFMRCGATSEQVDQWIQRNIDEALLLKRWVD